MAACGILGRVLAVILAAGTSSRLRPLTNHTPKSMLPILGRAMLRRSMDNLRAAGVREFVIVTGYLEAEVRRGVAEWYPGARALLLTNPDFASKGNGASLLVARSAAAGKAFLLLDADIVYEPAVVRALLESAHPDVIALRPAPDLGDEEMKIELDDKGWVKLISKEVEPSRAAGESIGIERFGAATSTLLFDTLADRIERRGNLADHYEHSFQELVDRGLAKLGVVDVGSWYCSEVDTPEDLARVEAEVRAKGWK